MFWNLWVCWFWFAGMVKYVPSSFLAPIKLVFVRLVLHRVAKYNLLQITWSPRCFSKPSSARQSPYCRPIVFDLPPKGDTSARFHNSLLFFSLQDPIQPNSCISRCCPIQDEKLDLGLRFVLLCDHLKHVKRSWGFYWLLWLPKHFSPLNSLLESYRSVLMLSLGLLFQLSVF